MIMNQKLIAFLKENGAYDAFVRNIEDPICNGATAKYLHPNPVTTLIARAFEWQSTPEGFDFWCELSVKWICLYDKQKEE